MDLDLAAPVRATGTFTLTALFVDLLLAQEAPDGAPIPPPDVQNFIGDLLEGTTWRKEKSPAVNMLYQRLGAIQTH